jgi:hypothetical protein
MLMNDTCLKDLNFVGENQKKIGYSDTFWPTYFDTFRQIPSSTFFEIQ